MLITESVIVLIHEIRSLIYVTRFLSFQAAGKDFDIGKMMNTFTLQMGYPVVSITKSSSKPGTYQAKQDRFLYYKDPTANYSTSPYG